MVCTLLSSRGEAEQPGWEERQPGQAAELLGRGFLPGRQHPGRRQHQGHPGLGEALQTESPHLVRTGMKLLTRGGGKEVEGWWGEGGTLFQRVCHFC